jgi:hypothetical protein
MFDWSDLLLLLPQKLSWVLLASFCLAVGALAVWVSLG